MREQALTVAAGNEVVVLHLADRRVGAGLPHLEEEMDGPLRTLRVRHGAPPAPRTVVNLWAVAAAVRRLRHTGFDPDLLHAHEFGAGLAAVVAGRLLRRPVIVSEHFSGFARESVHGTAALVGRRTFASADLVCPVSESLRATLEEGGWPGRFRVVPNSIDTDLFVPPAVRSTVAPPRIAVVAALEPVKGVGHLVEAAAILGRRGAEFRIEIAGSGSLRPVIAARARALELGDRLVLRGQQDRTGVVALLQGASFAVVPSEWETFSVVLGEAMACGLPVVATAVGGMPERIHAGNGILCRARDPAALADALERIAVGASSHDQMPPFQSTTSSPGAIPRRSRSGVPDATGAIAGTP